jgi:hypothetical protein
VSLCLRTEIWRGTFEAPFLLEKKLRVRVTRLGEFRPLGDSYFGHFLKITEEAHIFGGYFFPRLRFRIIYDTKVLGNILGAFFQKSSGHPAQSMYNKNPVLSMYCDLR